MLFLKEPLYFLHSDNYEISYLLFLYSVLEIVHWLNGGSKVISVLILT